MLLLRKLLRIVFVLLAALGLLLTIVSFTPVVPWYARLLGGAWNDPNGEVMIVLGGGMIDPEVLAPGSYWRSVYANRVWQGGGFREIVVSGWQVAPLMREFLLCHGVPAAAVRVENASHSTRENALFVARMLAGVPGRKILVTSDYHAYRAGRTFAKAGLKVEVRPYPDAIKASGTLPGRWSAFVDVTQETAKILYYRLRGWI